MKISVDISRKSRKLMDSFVYALECILNKMSPEFFENSYVVDKSFPTEIPLKLLLKNEKKKIL
jgi:hypothetical protein